MSAPAPTRRRILARVGAGLAALTVIFAAGPLYVWARGEAVLPKSPLDRQVTIRFASDASEIGWHFQPQEKAMTLRLGETGLAFFDVANPGARPMAGSSIYKVTPPEADKYLVRVACFCTETQVLQAGERAQVPMGFYVDPAIAYDRGADHVREITLTYSFHETEIPAAGASAVPAKANKAVN